MGQLQGQAADFPTPFRRSVTFPDLTGIVSSPVPCACRRTCIYVDAVYTWKMPPRDPLRERLGRHYERIASRSGGELWQCNRIAECQPLK